MADNRSRLRNLVLGCAGAAAGLLLLGAFLLAAGMDASCRDCQGGSGVVLATVAVGSLVLGAFAALGAVLSIAHYARALGRPES